MSEHIVTKATSSETMDVSPIVLRETTTTRLIFSPKWVSSSDNPLRGGFIFQRKGPKDTWENFDSKPLSSMHMNEGYTLNLEGAEISMLLNELDNLNKVLPKYGHAYGEREIELSAVNANGIFVQIGDIKNRDWVIQKLQGLKDSDFESISVVIGKARLENVIQEFGDNFSNKDESYWQSFFERNTWVLQQIFAYPVIYLNGETYLGGKNSKGRNGSGGVATDFLYQNGSNGSFAVVEIKTPSTALVGSKYRGEKEKDSDLYAMAPALTGSLVQLENQVVVSAEEFVISKDFDGVTRFNPVGVLIVGNYGGLTDPRQKLSFDLFRKTVGNNRIVTFDEVLEKLKLLRLIYED